MNALLNPRPFAMPSFQYPGLRFAASIDTSSYGYILSRSFLQQHSTTHSLPPSLRSFSTNVRRTPDDIDKRKNDDTGSTRRNSKNEGTVRRQYSYGDAHRHRANNLESGVKEAPAQQELTHLNSRSEIHVVPISDKPITRRRATAVGKVSFSKPTTRQLVIKNSLRKGDVLAVARVAGIMAAKQTSNLVPLCHNGVGIEAVNIRLEVVPPLGQGPKSEQLDTTIRVPFTEELNRWMKTGFGSEGGVRIQVTVESEGKTGVEMEALAGVAGAALTVVDMCKSVDKGLIVEGMKVVEKEGGRSGEWKAKIKDSWQMGSAVRRVLKKPQEMWLAN